MTLVELQKVLGERIEIANKLGTSKVTNVVSLGVLSSVCEIVSKDYLAKGVEKVLGEKKKSLLPLNEQALSAGADSLCVSQ